MARSRDPLDPRGLIRESYAIEDIGPEDCRSIFLDWALGAKEGDDGKAAAALLARYGAEHPRHPMTAILRQAAEAEAAPRRRGGRRGRG